MNRRYPAAPVPPPVGVATHMHLRAFILSIVVPLGAVMLLAEHPELVQGAQKAARSVLSLLV